MVRRCSASRALAADAADALAAAICHAQRAPAGGAARGAARARSRADRASRGGLVIGRLEGCSLEKRPDAVLLDVAGVGYELPCRSRRSCELPDEGKTVAPAHAHPRARGRAAAASASRPSSSARLPAADRGSAVGPRIALAILSGLPPRAWCQARARRRPRGAARHPRRRQEDGGAHRDRAARQGRARSRPPSAGGAAPRDDASEAVARCPRCVNLGYPRAQAERAVQGARSSACADAPTRVAGAGGAALPRRRMSLRRRAAIGEPRASERGLEETLRPAHARRVRRPGDAAREPARLHPRRARARRAARPRALLRPAGPRQDDARAHHRARAGRAAPRHVGPGDRAHRRPRRDPHEPRAARAALHRRDPPAAARSSRRSSIRRWRTSARPDHRPGAERAAR